MLILPEVFYTTQGSILSQRDVFVMFNLEKTKLGVLVIQTCDYTDDDSHCSGYDNTTRRSPHIRYIIHSVNTAPAIDKNIFIDDDDPGLFFNNHIRSLVV